MRTLQELDLIPVWVNPTHLISTAIHVMQGHRQRALAVIDDSGVVGYVNLERALGMPKDAKVQTIVQPLSAQFDHSVTIRTAAKRFIEEDLSFATVYEASEFCGILSANMLLQELGRSWDPLTSLPWSNRLRDWATKALADGREITVVFLDINDFGAYNKKHGHIVGDRILKRIADLLTGHVDRRQEICVRYGGDEFAIGTTLNRFAAEKKYGGIEDMSIAVEGVPDPVTIAVGFAGGKRTRDREHSHIASMVDNLINLASKECMARKLDPSRKRVAPAPETEGEEPARKDLEASVQPSVPASVPEVSTAAETHVRLVSADAENRDQPVVVTISVGGSDATGVVTKSEGSLDGAIAEATAHALERLQPSAEVTISEVLTSKTTDGAKMVTVVGNCILEGVQYSIAASRVEGGDRSRAIADAVVGAFLSIRKPPPEGKRISFEDLG
ncbi:MAG: diguanylate cyclase [Armatimonadetes bacterium]|nr:diguanylate cyclase [Armatimonadota bacterium]